jgi:hypothetical protein
MCLDSGEIVTELDLRHTTLAPLLISAVNDASTIPKEVDHDSFSIYSAPVVCGNFALFVSTKGLLAAVNLLEKQFLWSFNVGSPVFSTPLLLRASIDLWEFILGDVDGVMRRMHTIADPGDSASYKLQSIWNLNIPRPIFSSPCFIGSDAIVVGAHDGKLFKCILFYFTYFCDEKFLILAQESLEACI